MKYIIHGVNGSKKRSLDLLYRMDSLQMQPACLIYLLFIWEAWYFFFLSEDLALSTEDFFLLLNRL